MTARPVFSRRRFLAGTSFVALASAGTWPLPAFAQTGGELDVFLALSEDVTGHAGLDPVFAKAILAAFRSVGVERDLAAIAPERDGAARRALLKAWYLGRIAPNGIPDEDDEAEAIVVGFEATLMGRVVADLIPLPSYCGGRPHFWTEPPEDPDVRQGGAP
jgi:fructose 5-dehydrogenase small subunit